jgi:GTPase
MENITTNNEIKESTTSSDFIISIIGRPNVGKSSIFNRLLGDAKRAITKDQAGVTRDRHYAILNLDETYENQKQSCLLVDTGGFFSDDFGEVLPHQDIINSNRKKLKVENEDKIFFNIMRKQAELAIEESDFVLLVLDLREGLNIFDENIITHLRKMKKEFWVLINKYDHSGLDVELSAFYGLDVEFNDLIPLSASHGLGFLDFKRRLQDKLILMNKENLNSNNNKILSDNILAKVAIVGAPNAGKSTLLNYFLGSQRALVSEIAGTTRDPVHGLLKIKMDGPLEEFIELADNEGSGYVQLIDTAGIRKNKLIKENLESESVYRSLKAMNESDVIIVLVNSTRGITHHDRRLCDIAIEKGKSIIVCFNKVDELKKTKTPEEIKYWMSLTQGKIKWLEFCDWPMVSALKGENIKFLESSMKKTISIRLRKLSTSLVNKCFNELVDKNPLMFRGAKKHVPFKVKYSSMVKSSPPTFLIFANRVQNIPQNYLRYLKNGLRKNFDFTNTPIHLVIRKNSKADLKEEASD